MYTFQQESVDTGCFAVMRWDEKHHFTMIDNKSDTFYEREDIELVHLEWGQVCLNT